MRSNHYQAIIISILDYPLPTEGRISFHVDIADTVTGANWIQESVPERLDVKHAVISEIQISSNAVIGSSTSGFKPSELQQCANDPSKIVVTHPFNPVYLLPLVELVTNNATSQEAIQCAKSVIEDVGMYALHLTKEIEAHLADRLLEAVWREALWLVKDKVATTQQVDDAIRFGFGLRWAQMGIFETYRIAGGDAGIHHFLSQFGPALALPWTKLMDTPKLNKNLINLLSRQLDAQSGHYSVQELERIRDKNLVGIMRQLKATNWGVGRWLSAHDADQKQKLGLTKSLNQISDLSVPILTLDQIVPLTWIDYNGHMTESRYLDAFGQATDRFMEIIGCDKEYIADGFSYFTAESHIRHLREVKTGQRITIYTQLLLGEGKKLHLFHRCYQDEYLVATGEHFLLLVSLKTRESSVPSENILSALERITQAHRVLRYPDGAGASIRKPTTMVHSEHQLLT